jgi:hypothetical protein
MNFPFKFEPNEEVVGFHHPATKIRIALRLVDQDSGEAFYYVRINGEDGLVLDSASNIEERFTRVN